MNRQLKQRGWRWTGWAATAAIAGWIAWQPVPEDVQAETSRAPKSIEKDLADGEELFHRSWLPEDPRSPEGDGLGPMFNESSCAGCHNQGGPGGGGSTSKNVELLTAFIVQPQMHFNGPMSGPIPNGTFPNPVSAGVSQPQTRGTPQVDRKAIVQELMTIHPDFEKNSSVVVHRFGTSPKHNQWRTSLLTPQPQQFQALNTILSDAAVEFAPDFHGPSDTPAVDAVPATGFPPSEPPRPVTPEGFSAPAETTARVAPGSQPAQPQPATPVPLNVTFQQVPQAAQLAVGVGSTGIPLVDEALQEMRRLQQEARQDLSGSTNRGRVILLRSQRNTSALFGTGQIDAIPDEVLQAAAKAKHEDFPRVSGRVHRLQDNSIGKFGWKAQKSTLREFTLAACANELGLDVPGHAQPGVPYEAHEKSKGHDMTGKEADALVAYVRSLPAPIQETPDDDRAAKLIEEGKSLFESVGCAVCHKQDMGEAKGIYSDLLLHDMGDQLQASGSYGSFFVPEEFDPQAAEPAPGQTGPGSPSENAGPGTAPGESSNAESESGTTDQANQSQKPQPASSAEWRTPPLWGIRDSAPYLHDGRTATLQQAIAMHGGEGSDAAIRFFMLPAKKQQRVIAFLKTLRAPEQHAAN